MSVLDIEYSPEVSFEKMYGMLCKHQVIVLRQYTKVHPVPKKAFAVFNNSVLGM